MAPQRKSTIYAIFLHSKQQKPYQRSLRTQEPTPIGSETSLGPSMDPTGTLKQMVPDTSKDSYPRQQKSRKCVFWPFLNRHQKKLFYSLFQTRPKYYESSKTEYSDSTSFINRLTPLQANFRGPLIEKALQGPFMVKTDQFFYIGLQTTDKLKFPAWFEVNPTFGSREIRLLKPGGPIGPPFV